MVLQANVPVAASLAGGLNLLYAAAAFGVDEVCPGPWGTGGCGLVPAPWALVALFLAIGLLMAGGIGLVHEGPARR